MLKCCTWQHDIWRRTDMKSYTQLATNITALQTHKHVTTVWTRSNMCKHVQSRSNTSGHAWLLHFIHVSTNSLQQLTNTAREYKYLHLAYLQCHPTWKISKITFLRQTCLVDFFSIARYKFLKIQENVFPWHKLHIIQESVLKKGPS